MSIFEKFVNAYIWLRLFASPFCAGLLVAYVIWLRHGSLWKLEASAIVLLGVIIGINFAENVRKKYGDAFTTGAHGNPEDNESWQPYQD